MCSSWGGGESDGQGLEHLSNSAIIWRFNSIQDMTTAELFTFRRINIKMFMLMLNVLYLSTLYTTTTIHRQHTLEKLVWGILGRDSHAEIPAAAADDWWRCRVGKSGRMQIELSPVCPTTRPVRACPSATRFKVALRSVRRVQGTAGGCALRGGAAVAG